MEEINRARRPLLRTFDRVHRELEALLLEDEMNVNAIEVKFKMLSDKYESLQQLNNKMIEQMVRDNVTEEEEDKVHDEIDQLVGRYEAIRIQKETLMPGKLTSTESVSGLSAGGESRIRNFKLPTIEMKKFSGELSDWLAWWAQFKKIDEDLHMHGSDKFTYLLQSLHPDTDAYESVMGIPQTDENYPKAIAILKKRYGNQDLLLQVYIRQLLNLVISNVSAKEKIPVQSLYMKLDSHLRALKTLELEKADPSTWLFPLVESSLLDQILDNWQRSALSSHDGTKEDPPRTRLDLLMEFLEKEVDIKQRIDITRTFAPDQNVEKKGEQRSVKIATRRMEKRPAVPTMTSFHNAEIKSCGFCGLTNHETKICHKAKMMTYDEKMKILREKRLCFRCCGTHRRAVCKLMKQKCSICQHDHLTILCKDFRPRSIIGRSGEPATKRTRFETPDKTLNSSTSQPTVSSANIGCSGRVALKTLLVKVSAVGKEKLVRAFIDDGCERSYILKSTAVKMGLKPVGAVSAIHLLWGGHRTSEIQHHQYNVKLKSSAEDFEIDVTLRGQETICGKLVNAIKKYPCIREELQQKDVQLSDMGNGGEEIEMLIGADVYPHLLTGKFLHLSSGPTAILTKLGWTLMGEISNIGDNEESTSAAVISMAVSEGNVSKFWDLELMGIRDPSEESAIKKKEELAREQYVASITRDSDGRYLVKLPWKDNLPYLPDNRAVAFKRLQSSTSKLLQSGMYNNYDQIISSWEKEGFIEKVSVEDDALQMHYLPHRAVIKPDSLTTPVRPVFDASCRVGKSPSLNDCLFTGENCIMLIFEILMRFREKKIGFVSDIRKAFQMIAVHPSDRDVLRFLWWNDEERKKVVEYKHARVVFGVTCSPFVLAAVLFVHLTSLPKEDQDMGNKLLSTLYVDNSVSTADTFEEYKVFRDRATEIMKRASMDLRMWLNNVEDLDDQDTRIVSVLGLLWDRKEDNMFINMKNFSIPEKVTKRTILSTIQKIFDPIGFTTPCILPMKILLQQTWQEKAKWDEDLPESTQRKFLKWSREVKEIGKMKIPRLFSGGVSDKKNWTLLVFSDASAAAYSGAVYLRAKTGEKVSVQLLCAKSRVAPVKKMTIPKLELMGCLLAVRLLVAVKKALGLDDVPVRLFTDSTTALAWIVRDDQWGTFVANRVKEIRLYTSAEVWSHVPGEINPADLPSRGCTPSQLMNGRWWEGPDWIYGAEDSWPMSVAVPDENAVLAERKKTATTEVVTSFSVIDRVQNSRSFISLVRVIGYVRRFLHKFVKRVDLRRSGPLKKDELVKAEKILVREIQRDAFPESERHNLTGLELCKDDWGVLRVKTRLTYREDLGDYRYPVLLPGKDDRVKTLIADYHRFYCHAGVQFLMTTLRKKYWIIKSRQTIRGVIHKCKRCRRYSAKSVIPEPAPLPLDRVKDAEVFEVVGVDLAGPLILKNGSKAWLVIFTCGVYRAVHFELVKSLSTNAFLKAFEVFCEKFRRPAVVYSDNGTNFRGADNLFKKIDWKAVEDDEKISKIEWKFNPVTSSWWGGMFERLIRTTKDLLKRTIGKGSLKWEELKSILKVMEEVMNNRPLTYVSEDPEDLEPLTPAMFLNPLGKAKLPEREMTDAQKLRCRWKYLNTLKRELKNRFLKEYLSMLVNRNPKKATRELRVGELVLVGSDNVKRLEWPLARVLEKIPGGDKVCRLAKIKTEKGEMIRSVQRLFPLEADSEVESKKLSGKAVVTRSGRTVKRPDIF